MNLFALVKNSSACTSLLGIDPVRFFEFGQAPKLEVRPYATYQHITGTPFNNLSGPAAADAVTVQVDVWANTSAECKAIANALRQALEQKCLINSWLGTSRDGDAYRTIFTIQFVELR